MRALYATGFFRDVELRRDGSTLVVVVLERPSIESFEIKGNKDIKTEDLHKSLRNVGLAAGKTFDRSVLDEVKRFLTDQYYSRGKYAREDRHQGRGAARQPGTRQDRHQGRQARQDPPDQHRRQRRLQGQGHPRRTSSCKTPNLLSWYKQDDRYSRESLPGDLEKLRSYYLDRGYANFDIESTQVAISPEKDDMFITVNVNEGEIYKIGDVKIAGNMVVPEEELQRLRAGAAGPDLLAAA